MRFTPRPHLFFEQRFGYPEVVVGGVDEVGRGCLAGPVVACCFVLPVDAFISPPDFLDEVTDSKAISAEKRERLAPNLEAWAADFSVGVASVGEIDQLNILYASHLAMARAVEGLKRQRPAALLVDGNLIPRALSTRPARAIVKGDLRSISIAASSIVAKVYRDRLMVELGRECPGYGFEKHAGYGTAFHREALARLGVTRHHRRSFGPVKERLGQAEVDAQAER